MKAPRKGLYKPINPEKYVGDPNNIVHRSNLEKRFFKIFDENPNIVSWMTDGLGWMSGGNKKDAGLAITYFNKTENKVRRYFPDLIIKAKTRDGSYKIYVLEIKPKAQTMPPKSKKNTKRYITEMQTWQVNQDKWSAAQEFCKSRGIQFLVLTEEHLRNRF